MKLYCLYRFLFSIDLAFVMFATGVSARYTSRYLECFSFVQGSHISERRFWKKFNSNVKEQPKNFSFLFIFLIRNSEYI